MVRLIVLVFFTKALLGHSLTADPVCQVWFDGLTTSSILGNPCSGEVTCPTTCKQELDDTDAACAGKNVEISYTNESEATAQKVVTYVCEELPLFSIQTFAKGTACKDQLFDYGLACVTDCMSGYSFAAIEVLLNGYCTTTAGGDSETSCHANCQLAINAAANNCKYGDVYTQDGSTWGAASMLGLSWLGPSTCSYGTALISGAKTISAGSLLAITAALLLG